MAEPATPDTDLYSGWIKSQAKRCKEERSLALGKVYRGRNAKGCL